MEKLSRAKLYKKHRISYLGACKQSAKVMKSYLNGTLTYCIYLAPSDMSGHNVCPFSEHCKDRCLNASGHNRIDIWKNGYEGSKINRSRIKKTRLFFDNRNEFMTMVVGEINRYMNYAEKHNLNFAVRLNGTSDLDPQLFTYEGKTILELFPNVQFYDYTKVPNRIRKYADKENYFLTFSFDGYNWDVCEDYLQKGGQVAVVFDSHKLPTTYKGYKVVNGNDYDMRYLDGKGVVIGLTYHPTAADRVNGKIVIPNDPFIVKVG